MANIIAVLIDLLTEEFRYCALRRQTDNHGPFVPAELMLVEFQARRNTFPPRQHHARIIA